MNKKRKLEELGTQLEESGKKIASKQEELRDTIYETQEILVKPSFELSKHTQEGNWEVDEETKRFVLDTRRAYDRMHKLPTENIKEEKWKILLENEETNKELEYTQYMLDSLKEENIPLSIARQARLDESREAEQSLIKDKDKFIAEHHETIDRYIQTMEEDSSSEGPANEGGQSPAKESGETSPAPAHEASQNPANKSGDDGANEGGDATGTTVSRSTRVSVPSLLNDYADTSTEMPSYMDPED